MNPLALKGPRRVALSLAVICALFGSRAEAAPVTSFSSDCGQASQELLVADSADPLRLTVSGPVSAELIGEGACTVTWTAETILHLEPGYYAIGAAIDFDYVLDAQLFGEDQFGLAFLSWDITQSLTETVANIAFSDTIFWQTPQQSGHVSVEGDSTLFPAVYLLAGGDYTLQQTGTMMLTLFGGSVFTASLDFPASSYVIPTAAPPVPEPVSIVLLGTGLGAFAIRRRRARKT